MYRVIVLGVAGIAVVALCLFPPELAGRSYSTGNFVHRAADTVDVPRLFARVAAVVVVAALAVYLPRLRKRANPPPGAE